MRSSTHSSPPDSRYIGARRRSVITAPDRLDAPPHELLRFAFAALVIVAPAGVAVHAWRASLPITWALPVVISAGFIAVVAVFLTGEFWWSAHDRGP
jgi:hypothetical protein